jgi:excisionase family DNA binding protein
MYTLNGGAMELLTVAETAKLLKVNPMTVRRYIQDGRLPAVRVGRRVRVHKEAVEGFLAPITPQHPGAHDQGKGGSLVQTDRFVPRPLTAAEQQQMVDAIAQSRRFQEKLRAKYDAQPVEPGWQLLDAAREQRTRELA